MGKKKPAKVPRGRPPKLRTPRQRERFLKALRDNLGSIRAACRACKIGFSLVSNERQRDPDFAAAIDDAREAAIDGLVETGVKLANAGDGAMIRFFLPRLRPSEYAETQRVKYEGQVNVNNDVRITIVEDPDWYGKSITHDPAANGATPPGSDPALPGTVQASCVRPAMGEDGRGPDGDDPGARPDAGDV